MVSCHLAYNKAASQLGSPGLFSGKPGSFLPLVFYFPMSNKRENCKCYHPI